MADPEKVVHSAARSGNFETVAKMLKEYPELDINSTHETGVWTALHESCDFGKLDITVLLLQQPRIDVNQQDKDGRTGLYWATNRNRTDVIDHLLRDERVDVNKPNFSGESPFQKAVNSSSLTTVQQFLACGRKLNLENVNPTDSQIVTLLARYKENMKEITLELRKTTETPAELELGTLLSYAARVPEDFSDLKKITDLSLADCLLDTVPAKLGEMVNLVNLSLMTNNISTLPELMGTYSKLTKLNLSFNKLASLPEFIGNCVQLEHLNVKGNQLTDLPASMAKLTKLTKLDLSDNQFSFVPDCISKLPITYLKLNRNKITTLPAWLPSNKSITELNLNGNPGIKINEAVPFLVNVKILHAKACEITEISNEFCTLTQLTWLNLSANRITVLPDSFAKLTNLTILKIRGESDFVGYNVQGKKQLSPSAAKVIAQLIQSAPGLKKLNLLKCDFKEEGALTLAHSLVWCFENNKTSLVKLEVDDISVTNPTGLDIIPLDIRQRGIDDIARFMVDLFRSPKAPPVYRSKIMVVGYESVGKTTVLDCVFVHSGWLVIKEKFMLFLNKRNRYWFEIQGRQLRQYSSPSKSKLLKTTVLENRKWQLEDVTVPPRKKDKGIIGFVLRKTAGEDSGASLELRCEAENDKTGWLHRLKREVMNAATHGIEVNNHAINHPLTKEVVNEQSQLEVSVWDFAGQHDYYNNHHYFLQARTVFLVLWKMSEGDEGLKSLEFWFKSLAIHLPKEQNDPSGKPLFSILVVGTFLDKLAEADQKEGRPIREKRIKALALDSGLTCVVECHEVSCYNLANVDNLTTSIVRNVLSHSYMGERVPLTYLMVEDAIRQLRGNYQPVDPAEPGNSTTAAALASASAQGTPSTSTPTTATPAAPETAEPEKQEVPLVSLDVVMEKAQTRSSEQTQLTEKERASLTFDVNLIKRALKLLFAWGECVYFDSNEGHIKTATWVDEEDEGGQKSKADEKALLQLDEEQRKEEISQEVSNIVVLDPTFLTKDVLANLFKPGLMSYYKDGIIQHTDLAFIWPKYIEQAPALMALMEKFEVCFRLRDVNKRKFIEQSSIISSLLPEARPQELAQIWPEKCPAAFKGENYRIISFNVVPKEMVSRLIVRLHKLISNQKLWRYGIFLVSKQTQALVEVKITEMEDEGGADLSAHSTASLTLVNAPKKDGDADKKGPAKLKRRDKYRPSGKLFVTVRGNDPRLRKDLMETIVEIIAVTAEGYPGMTMHQFVRSPNDPDTLINLAEVLADSQRAADDHRLVCPKTMLPLNAESLLADAGVILSETPEEKQVAIEKGLPDVTDLRKMFREELNMSQRNLLHNAQQIIKHSYPTAFLLLPMELENPKPTTLMNCLKGLVEKAERFVFEKSQLHCLCEFRIRDQNGQMQACWHPTDRQGIELQELTETMRKVGSVLKASLVVLQVVGVAARLAGVPFPNLGEVSNLVSTYASHSASLLSSIKGEYDTLHGESDDQVLLRIKENGPGALRPKDLEGDALLTVKPYFGDVAAGYLTKAGLRQCFVLFDGPMGNAGDVLWLCESHADMLALQNDQKLAEIQAKVSESYAGFWKG